MAHPPLQQSITGECSSQASGLKVNCTYSFTKASYKEFFTNQFLISWQISTQEYICTGDVKAASGSGFLWIRPAHQFIIHQSVGDSRGWRTKIPNSLQPYFVGPRINEGPWKNLMSLKLGMREGWKAAQIKTEIPLETPINQAILKVEVLRFKDQLYFLTSTFISSPSTSVMYDRRRRSHIPPP